MYFAFLFHWDNYPTVYVSRIDQIGPQRDFFYNQILRSHNEWIQIEAQQYGRHVHHFLLALAFLLSLCMSAEEEQIN